MNGVFARSWAFPSFCGFIPQPSRTISMTGLTLSQPSEPLARGLQGYKTLSPVEERCAQSHRHNISKPSALHGHLLCLKALPIFFSPLRVFLPLSALCFCAGGLYYLYTFLNSHRFTNMSALLLTTSIIIFMLGLVSE